MAAVVRRERTKSEDCYETKNALEDSRDFFSQSHRSLVFLLAVKSCSVLWNNISDCDETYNYWEPTHYLLYGYGFQTWEYSPLYAIRSYAYIWIHSFIGCIFNVFLDSKVLIFYMIRGCLGIISALSEFYLYRGICYRFGSQFASIVLMFLLFGAGMFISSTAYLPSSFSMYMTMISYGSLFLQHSKVSIVATAASALVGWPFSAVLGIPIAYDILLRRKKTKLFISMCIISLITILGSVVLIDSYYYGCLVISPLNIILYNVFSEHGPDIYGVEPWPYYFINGFLNFNIVYCAALLSGPLALWCWMKAKYAEKNKFSEFFYPLTGMYTWILIFFSQPHKEERFLFPIYPLICINGAIAFHFIQKTVIAALPRRRLFPSPQKYTVIVAMVYILLSISRILALCKGYSAPTQLFLHLKSFSGQNGINHSVCIGKEWHRFPSNFFLPENFRMHFIRSGFHGQLPKPFSSLPNATQIIPDGMNDQNVEEGNQYRDIENCQYLVDSDLPSESLLEPSYSKQVDKWEIVFSLYFLDARRSPRLLRAFYIPYLSEKYCNFVKYNLLQKK